MSAERGIVFGASGLPWLQETLVSADSVRRRMPDLPLELHIDRKTRESLPGDVVLEKFFDFVSVFDRHAHWRSPKFAALQSRRFARSLYLDGDTYLTTRIDELFDLLDRFDLAALPAPQRLHWKAVADGIYEMFPTVPASFPEYNGGVILFRRNDRFDRFVDQWLAMYERCIEEKNYVLDQAAFRVALYHSDLRLSALTPEYNFRAITANIVKGDVKLIHAHGDLPRLAQEVNARSPEMRVLMPDRTLLHGYLPEGTNGNDESDAVRLEKQIRALRSTFDALKPG